MLPDFSAFCGVRWAPQNAIGPSTLFQAYKTIKHMEKQGRERSEICEMLKEKFGEKNPDVKV